MLHAKAHTRAAGVRLGSRDVARTVDGGFIVELPLGLSVEDAERENAYKENII